MVIKLDERKIFTGSTTRPALAKIFVTQMLTHEQFVVADLLV